MALGNNIEILTYFGLTNNQANVYLSIGSSIFITAKQIHEVSEVPRQHIYRILSALQQIGLVESTISRPLRFKGIPIQKGISFLFTEKIEETKKMKKKAEKIIEYQRNNNIKIQKYEPHFVLISKKEASLIKRQEEIDNAKKSIDFISSWKRLPLTIDTFGENVRKALERGVNMRVILEKPKDLNQIPETVQNLKEFPNYKLRYFLGQPSAIIGIFDRKRAITKTSVTVGLAEKSSLWTDNPCLVSVIQDHFEMMWITAMEKIPEKYVD